MHVCMLLINDSVRHGFINVHIKSWVIKKKDNVLNPTSKTSLKLNHIHEFRILKEQIFKIYTNIPVLLAVL